jgi:hypothetical protein
MLMVLLIALCFVAGSLCWRFGFNGNKMTAEAAQGAKLVSELFNTATYKGPVIPNDETSPLQYISGDWVIQTDAYGKKILSVALSDSAAKRIQENIKVAISDDELIDLAKDEWKKYFDLKYSVKNDVSKQGGMVNIDLAETKYGRETGAKAAMSFFEDGTLFCASYSDRVLDFPENEPILDEVTAYEKAYKHLVIDRTDLEIKYNIAEANTRLFTTDLGQMYSFEFYGASKEHPDWDVACNAVIYAVSGEVSVLSYEDR